MSRFLRFFLNSALTLSTEAPAIPFAKWPQCWLCTSRVVFVWLWILGGCWHNPAPHSDSTVCPSAGDDKFAVAFVGMLIFPAAVRHVEYPGELAVGTG
jgi:hypothetical protein